MDSLGRRIAKRRAELGWTQQELADRIAVSRVALSHLETDLTAPLASAPSPCWPACSASSRTSCVAGTTYPAAKADRSPLVVARHTEVELQCRLLDRDLELVERTGDRTLLDGWATSLSRLHGQVHDARQRLLVEQALARLRRAEAP